MADVTADNVDVVPKPKKKSIFSKNAVAPRTESVKALDFFSRGRETFEWTLEENKRKKETKTARLERKRPSKSADLKDNSPFEEKRRKLSAQKHAETGYSSEDGSQNEHGRDTPPITRRDSSHTSPEGRKSSYTAQRPQKSATSLSERYSRDLNAQKSELVKKPQSYIALSDSDDEDDQKATKTNITTIPVRKSVPEPFSISDDEDDGFYVAPKKPVPISDDDNDDDFGFSVEFPEFVQAAREREQQKAQQRLEATAKAAKEASGIEADKLDDFFDSSPQTGSDPVVDILITSKMADTKPVMVKRKLSQRLKEAKHGWCDKQTIPDQTKEEFRNSVFLMWRNHKLHDTTTSHSLGVSVGEDGELIYPVGMDFEGKIHLFAWTESAYQIYQTREAEKARKEEAFKEGKVEEPPAAVKIRLILKAKGMPDFKLFARPATTIEKMINAFRNAPKNQIPEGQALSVYFDGEKLDPQSTVEEADMDDMDVVEVHLN